MGGIRMAADQAGSRTDNGHRGESPAVPRNEEDLERIARICAAGADGDLWMDTRSVELYLGISRRTLYRLVKNGAIPVSRVGRRIRVSKRALDVAVAAGLVW